MVTVSGLAAPLMIIQAKGGMLACGYISIETCDRLREVCCTVSGVKSPEDMAGAEVKAVSRAAEAAGCRPGMTGEEALMLMHAYRPLSSQEAMLMMESLKAGRSSL